MKALYTAATGMLAQERNVEVVSNNIANLRTTGFKRVRAEFQDLLYQDYRRVGTTSSATGNVVPTGVQIGSGVKLAATTRVMSQGTPQITERDLDVAIRGEGFIQVNLPDGRTGYTRDGSLERNATGQLVTLDGYTIVPNITIPNNASNLTINAEGSVQATIGNSTTPTTLGQITLARFVNKAGLEAIGDNLFLETPASGAAQIGNPADPGYGNLLQRHTEAANVNSVAEISDLISAQRAYEMNSRVIRAADEMLSSTANIR